MRVFRWQKRRKFYRPARLLQQLEERIVLDAAVHPVNNNLQSPAENVSDGVDLTNTASQGGQTSTAGMPRLLLQCRQTISSRYLERDLNVVLISSDLDQVEALSSASVSGSQVIVYDAKTADLSTINSLLENVVNSEGRKIDHLALVTHGESGLFELRRESGM